MVASANGPLGTLAPPPARPEGAQGCVSVTLGGGDSPVDMGIWQRCTVSCRLHGIRSVQTTDCRAARPADCSSGSVGGAALLRRVLGLAFARASTGGHPARRPDSRDVSHEKAGRRTILPRREPVHEKAESSDHRHGRAESCVPPAHSRRTQPTPMPPPRRGLTQAATSTSRGSAPATPSCSSPPHRQKRGRSPAPRRITPGTTKPPAWERRGALGRLENVGDIRAGRRGRWGCVPVGRSDAPGGHLPRILPEGW